MALTTKRIAALTKSGKPVPGRHHDGHGLYLQVRPEGNASWLLRYELFGKERMLGLGPLHIVGLKAARERAQKARLLLLDGDDPIEAKAERRKAEAGAKAKAITFTAAAEAYFKQHSEKWRSRKHEAQVTGSVRDYCLPVIGGVNVSDVTTADVLHILERDPPDLWRTKTETAKRLRGRIEAILDWAHVRGYRTAENPARWQHLKQALPAPGQIRKAENHAALPFVEIGSFMSALRKREGIAARAVEFLILTAARTGEVIGATWNEIDLRAKTWTVPSERMKGGREHKVPLAPAALVLLEHLPRVRGNDHVFIGTSGGGKLSPNALARVPQRMGRDDITIHGFRSSFRDWAAERTNYQNHVVEMALAHTIGTAVERAYRRGDLFQKRAALMQQWAAYCAQPTAAASAKVVPLRA